MWMWGENDEHDPYASIILCVIRFRLSGSNGMISARAACRPVSQRPGKSLGISRDRASTAPVVQSL